MSQCRTKRSSSLVGCTFLLLIVAAGCDETRAPVVAESAEPAEPAAAPVSAVKPEPVANSRDSTEDFYTVKVYDPARDPAQDLAEAMRIAGAAKKRILIQVGGQWCGWCHRLDQYIADHEDVLSAIREGFVIMKVNFSDENPNEAFLSQYPSIPGYPHLFVLESDGTLLHSQDTVELEEGESYNEAAILAFAKRWKA